MPSRSSATGTHQPFKEFIWKFVVPVAVIVVAAMIVSIPGYLVGKWRTTVRYEKRFNDAPTQYVDDIGALIDNAAIGFANPLVEARAIVSARNDLRSSLLDLYNLLDSDIDSLERQLADPALDSEAGIAAIRSTIQVLARKWPTKRHQVEVEVRKWLVLLGLESQRDD